MKTAYLAAPGFSPQLESSLKRIEYKFGRLIVCSGDRQVAPWAQNVWYDVKEINIKSIGDAAQKLRAMQKLWCGYEFRLARRMVLIREKLPYIPLKAIPFPSALPKNPLGSWTLLDKDTMLAAAECSSRFPNGEVIFQENKTEPPARAYLKLWEALTLMNRLPAAKERCLDLGAAPGSWTWVVASLGAEVLAIDRSPLAPALAKFPNVRYEKGSAFAATPENLGAWDWLLCDVICYPEKLLAFINKWLASGLCKNFICTLKFQGEEHYNCIQEFAKIPDSQLLHLHHNKHELTWIKLSS